MTQTLAQINSNPLYAPLGEEALFKRRITLENFKKCLTIREFQKTAGREFIKSPSVKAIKPFIEKYHKKQFQFELYSNYKFYEFWINSLSYPVIYGVKRIDIKNHPEIKKLYTSKSGKRINSRYVRIWELISVFEKHKGRFTGHTGEESEALRRIGFFKVIDNFKKYFNMSGDIIQHQEYWDFSDYLCNWINRYNEYQFYFQPNWNEPQIRQRIFD